MRVADVMTEGVQTVDRATTVGVARALMQARGIDHLAVVEGSTLVGIVSSHDLDSRERQQRRGGRTVEDVMTASVVTVSPDAPVKRAANLMRGQSIGSIVVTAGRKLVGIITVSDLLDLIGRGATKPIARAKRWTLRHRVPHARRGRTMRSW